MDPSTSEAKQRKSWFKLGKKSEKAVPSPAKLAGRPKNLAAEVECIEPETTWDRAVALLRQRKPDIYADLQDLQKEQGSLSSSDWLQRTLADCKETRDDAHTQSRRNVEKVLRSVLVYKDVAVAVSRLDPHRIAPMVLTGVYVVAQVCSISFNTHCFFFWHTSKIMFKCSQ